MPRKYQVSVQCDATLDGVFEVEANTPEEALLQMEHLARLGVVTLTEKAHTSLNRTGWSITQGDHMVLRIDGLERDLIALEGISTTAP